MAMFALKPRYSAKGYSEYIAKAALNVEKLVRGAEREQLKDDWQRIQEIIEEVRKQPVAPLVQSVPFQPDCTCPPYGTCMNTACPRRIRITNVSGQRD